MDNQVNLLQSKLLCLLDKNQCRFDSRKTLKVCTVTLTGFY